MFEKNKCFSVRVTWNNAIFIRRLSYTFIMFIRVVFPLQRTFQRIFRIKRIWKFTFSTLNYVLIPVNAIDKTRLSVINFWKNIESPLSYKACLVVSTLEELRFQKKCPRSSMKRNEATWCFRLPVIVIIYVYYSKDDYRGGGECFYFRIRYNVRLQYTQTIIT